MTLVASTERIDDHDDLLDVAAGGGVVFARSGVGLAGRGVAQRIVLPAPWVDHGDRVTEALAAIDHRDDLARPGTGPVAFGALPFRPDVAAELVVPAEVVGRGSDGTRWRTIVQGPGVEPATDATAQDAGPDSYRITATVPADDWCGLVERGTKEIAAEAFRKVVLARELRIDASAPIPVDPLLAQLRERFAQCYLFRVGSMVGASPELLVAREGDTVRAHPMAGTAPRGGDPTSDARLAASLLASMKDRAEHQITIDMVWETLLPFCSYVDSEPEPSIVAVANVQHLASLVEGRLSTPAASVLELVRALHPTPAVAGWPVQPALSFLAAHEGIDRDRYAGPVGWVDAAGNGTWAVGIRSAIIEGAVARLFAGVGVVADSDPDLELAETRAKFQAMLAAIVRP